VRRRFAISVEGTAPFDFTMRARLAVVIADNTTFATDDYAVDAPVHRPRCRYATLAMPAAMRRLAVDTPSGMPAMSPAATRARRRARA